MGKPWMAGPRPRFTYRLRPGASAQRLGMFVMEREGVVAALARLRR